jgi:hypothetical protein
MLHLDGARSKSTLCDGVMILIVAKLGNGTQLHLGLAHVPVKSSLFMVWIVLLLRRGGLDVESIPIFLDRGNLLAASRILQNDHGLTLSTKFCLDHLIRNVISKFSISKAHTGCLRAVMASMQSSATIDVFVAETHRLMTVLDCRLGGKIAACLLQMLPGVAPSPVHCWVAPSAISCRFYPSRECCELNSRRTMQVPDWCGGGEWKC